MEDFQYPNISEGRLEQEIDRLIIEAYGLMWPLYGSVVVKMELNRKAKLSIDQRSHPQLLSGALGGDLKNKIGNASG